MGTEDNEADEDDKVDKDFQMGIGLSQDIMQKVCENLTDWRSVQGNGSPANEPDLMSFL